MSLDPGRSRAQRLLDGVGGQLYARGTLIVLQIVAVPLLISAWGVGQYGAWLALTAFAGVASNANFGVLNAFAVEINTIGPTGDARRLRDAIHTADLMLGLLLGPVLALMCAAGWALPVGIWLKLEGIGRPEILQILLLASVQIGADNLRAVSAAVIVGRGRYGLPNLVAGTLRLTEIAALAVLVLVFDGTIVGAAMIGAAGALLNLLLHRAIARSMMGSAHSGDRRFDRGLVRSLMPASMGNFILSIGVNALTVHGTRLALSAFLGPRMLAAYAVTMTAAKTVDQLNAALMAALQPEFSRLRGGAQADDASRLLTLGSQASLVSFVILAAALLAAGPPVFALWTGGTIGFSYPLAALLLAGVLMMQTAKAPQYFLLGNNAVLAFGIGSFIACAVGLAISIAAMPQWGVYGAASGFVVGEALVLAAVLVCAARQLGVAPRALLRRLFGLGELRGALAPYLRRGVSR